jgi:hypothetical protein
MELAEEEFLNVFLGVMGHDPSVNQKGDDMHLHITRTYQNCYRKSDKFHSLQGIGCGGELLPGLGWIRLHLPIHRP